MERLRDEASLGCRYTAVVRLSTFSPLPWSYGLVESTWCILNKVWFCRNQPAGRITEATFDWTRTNAAIRLSASGYNKALADSSPDCSPDLKSALDRPLISTLDESIELKATAWFDDGTQEDVTIFTVFTAEDSSAVTLDTSGSAIIRRKGRHLIIARYLDQVVPIEIVVPIADVSGISQSEESLSFIDALVDSRMNLMGLSPSDQATDDNLVRRLYLDLTGRLPSPEQQNAYLDNSSFTRRRDLIDNLVASEEFLEFWSLRFAELLRIQAAPKIKYGCQGILSVASRSAGSECSVRPDGSRSAVGRGQSAATGTT